MSKRKRKTGAIRKARGTPGRSTGDEQAVCGFCLNTGLAEQREGGWKPCRCGMKVVKP